MILRDDPRGTLLIGQPAHAWLSGRLAEAWAWPFAPRAEVCLAALQHDIGMAAWDARPVLDPATGLPHSFTSMPRAMHVSLWSRAAELLVAQSGYAALLVSLHGTGLYERYVPATQRAAEPVRSYLEHQRRFQAGLVGALALDRDQVARNAALLRCWDWLSLFACTAADAEGSFTGVPGDGEAVDLRAAWMDGERHRIAVAPWPFRPRRMQLAVEARLLTGRSPDQASLEAALAAAPVEVLRLELRPG